MRNYYDRVKNLENVINGLIVTLLTEVSRKKELGDCFFLSMGCEANNKYYFDLVYNDEYIQEVQKKEIKFEIKKYCDNINKAFNNLKFTGDDITQIIDSTLISLQKDIIIAHNKNTMDHYMNISSNGILNSKIYKSYNIDEYILNVIQVLAEYDAACELGLEFEQTIFEYSKREVRNNKLDLDIIYTTPVSGHSVTLRLIAGDYNITDIYKIMKQAFKEYFKRECLV